MPNIWIDKHYNFNEKQLRGCDINVLPVFRIFPPSYGRKNWTIHFAWLLWTVGIHIIRR